MSFATYQATMGVPRYRQALNQLQRHALVSCAVVVLVASVPASRYWLAQGSSLAVSPVTKSAAQIAGLNSSVNNQGLQATINKITSQPASLNLGSQTVAIPASTVRSWLKVTPSSSTDTIHVDANTIAASLTNLVKQYEMAPVNQVTSTAEGSPRIIVAGRNGQSLAPTANLSGQAVQLAKNLMDDKGFQVSAPLVSVPFQSVTPAAFPKLLEVDLTAKTMYAYQNGQIVRNFLVSAGAPDTPTPVGEYHIYAKYPVQDMWGYNLNGTKYFQPHVYWVNYFTGGDAVHGVYWHPLSWFGVHNSSHGCVGVSDSDAEWIYNWAPIGTTVITHA